MISFTGNGLNILITANCNNHNEWQSYASWYSIHKILPDADVALAISKPKNVNTTLFRWATRAKLEKHRFPNLAEDIGCNQATQLFSAYMALANNIQQPLAVLDCNTMALRDIDFNMSGKFGLSQDRKVWIFNHLSVDEFSSVVNKFFKLYSAKHDDPITKSLESIEFFEINKLCCDCTKNDQTTFVNVNSCGHYDKKTWPEQAKSSPFTYVKKLRKIDMSINESAVLTLWEQMQNPYALMI